MFTNLIKKLKSNRGNSLAEFAVTTAMMATLATTAAPKFGGVGTGAKEKKTMNNIDKIISVGNNFYNAAISDEGRGRFPGQTTDIALEVYVDTILDGLEAYDDDLSDFVYVFSPAIDDDDAVDGDWMTLSNTTLLFDADGAEDFKKNFGNSGMQSPFQDGSYIYLVIQGTGSGTDAQSPVLLVADTENPSQFYKTLVP